jgi:hypothetical protein
MANPYPNFINDVACGHIIDEIQTQIIARIDDPFTMLKFNLFQAGLLIGDENSMASHIVCPLMARVAELCGQVIPAAWKTYGDPPGSGVTRWGTGFSLPANPATLYSSPHFAEAVASIMEDVTFCEYLRKLMRDGLVGPATRPAARPAPLPHPPIQNYDRNLAVALALSRRNQAENNNDDEMAAAIAASLEQRGGRRNTRKHRKNRKSRRSTKNRKSRRSTKNRKASRKNRSRKH